MGIRLNLKILRIENMLTQHEMAKKIGCPPTTFQMIENGKRNGRPSFWDKLQTNFELSDKKIDKLKKCK